MRWFRHRTGWGVGLSLAAMALQLMLTLGHTHAGELGRHQQPSVHASSDAGTQHPTGHHHHDPDALCPDCLVIAQAATGLTASPPMLPAEATVSVPLVTPCIPAIKPARCRAGFHPRAPPRA